MNPIINIFEDISKKEPFIKQQYDALNKKKIKTSLNEIPFEDLIKGLKTADPISHKSGGKKTPYVNLLVKWLRNNSIKFPEDTEKCSSLFNKVSFLKTKGSSINPDSFNSFGDLYKAVSEEEKKYGDEEAPKTRWEKYAPVVFESGPYKLLKVDDYETQGKELFGNSGWCVAHESYFNQYKPPYYLVLKDEERYCLIHEYSGQIKDINDNPVNKFEQLMDKDLYNIIGKFNEDVTEDSDMVSDERNNYSLFLKDPLRNTSAALIDEYLQYIRGLPDHTKLIDYIHKVFKSRNVMATTIIFNKFMVSKLLTPEIVEYYVKLHINDFLMMRLLFDKLTTKNIEWKMSPETFNKVANVFGNKIVNSPDSQFKDICYTLLTRFTKYLTSENIKLLLTGNYRSIDSFHIIEDFLNMHSTGKISKEDLNFGENLFKPLSKADLGGVTELFVKFNIKLPDALLRRLSDDPTLVKVIYNLLIRKKIEIPEELKLLLPKETNLREMIESIFYRN